MRLSHQIARAGLSDAVALTFAEGLLRIAEADGQVADIERQLIARLVASGPAADAQQAPFEALWPHADLFLAACVTVAVADGTYGVEEARLVSLFAHRLGYSARRLSELEARVFAQLKESGAQIETQAPPEAPPKAEAKAEASTETTLKRRIGASKGAASGSRPRKAPAPRKAPPDPSATAAWLRDSDSEIITSERLALNDAMDDVTEPGGPGPRARR